MADSDSQAPQLAPEKNTISPQLALELRIRQLNSLLTGQPTLGSSTATDTSSSSAQLQQPVLYQLAEIEQRFSELTDASDGVRRFVQSYDLNAPLLNLSNSVPGPAPAPQEPKDWLTKAILVLEQESDFVHVEKDLRDIQVLVEQRSVDQPGQLESSKALQEPLRQLRRSIEQRTELLDALEDQTTALLGDYNTYVGSPPIHLYCCAAS